MHIKKILAALVLLASSDSAFAVYNGPVGTPCGGTTTSGTTMTGTQGWSTNPATGQGYWSCCQAGTSCVGRDKPKDIVIRNPDVVSPTGTHPTKQAAAQKRIDANAKP